MVARAVGEDRERSSPVADVIPLESPGAEDAPEGWWEEQHSGLDAEGEARVAALDAERARGRMFRPGEQNDLAPSGARARFRANLEALTTLRAIQNDPALPGRLATPAEQQVLARWGGWGAQGLWQVFDEDKPEYAEDRAQLHQVLNDAEYVAARRTTINAHYTDPLIGREMWAAVQRLGFDGGRVLEPGCGAGTFIGLAPEGVQAVGVELDPTTAAIAQALYPAADIRAESFADTRLPADTFALEAALPADVLAGDITPRIGAVWIPDTDHEAFLQQILGRNNLTVRRLARSEWEVEYGDWGIQATQEWGTDRMPAGKLLARLAAQKPIVVQDTQQDGSVVFNPTETAAAVEKATQLQERFAEWVWEDPARTVRLVEAYNRTFNSVVLRDYTEEGKVLTLPGLAKDFVPRDHQRAAVARMIAEPSVGLFHEVGAGKTAEMAIGCTELKRLGLVNKPAICVPNHMLDQFAREWLQLYPQARILAAGSDELKTDQRTRFVARVATNDWDAVILTRTAFERLSLQPEHEAEFLDRQLDQTREAIQRANERGSSAGLRRAEKKLARREEALKAKRDMPRDPGISWEETGIDYVVIDELHEYKNLSTTSQITDANIDGSKRAMDLLAKVEYLRSTQGERVMCGATATPIANSVAEMHVMQRFLDPESLAEAGLSDFDSWAATFGEVTQNMELTVTGGNRFKVKTRLAKFTNVPELQTMFRRFADVKTAEDLDLPRPELVAREDGKRALRIITVPRSEELADYITQIGERADAIAARLVEPTEDNMLKLSSDGRKAALDMRLVDPAYGPTGGKIDAAADELVRVWEQTRHLTYTEPGTGEVSPIPGGLQLVFCDLGTPSQRWNVYDALKDALVARGMPAETIRFVHEAKTDTEKARLFEACRAGRVSVIVGSTSKMGVGTNIQNRAVHLMDLDAPWRPADVAQRHGRIQRQGNQNDEVMITQVVTEGSFDTFMWQTLERKSRFIAQIMSGRNVGRETADIGEETLSFAEVKAISSGNPLLLELADAEQDLQRLTRLERSHATSQRSLVAQLKQATARVTYIDQTVPELAAAAQRTRSTKGDAFSITFCDGRTFTERAAAAAHLEDMITGRPRWSNPILTIAGHQIELAQDQFTYAQWRDRWSILGAPDVSRDVLWSTDQPRTPLGTIARLENLPEQIVARIERLTVERAEQVRVIGEAERLIGRPFKHHDALLAARDRYAAVTTEIGELANQPEAAQRPDSSGIKDADLAQVVATAGLMNADSPGQRAAHPSPAQPPTRWSAVQPGTELDR